MWGNFLSQPSALTVVIIVLVLAGLGVARYWPDSKKLREPPSIRSGIPLIGHVWGLCQHKLEYVVDLSFRSGLRIFTLPILTGKVYVVTDPDLVASIQKNQRDYSFWVIEAPFAAKLVGLSNRTTAKLLENILAKHGQTSLFAEGMAITRSAVMPGPTQLAMNQAVAAAIEAAINGLSRTSHGPLDLWEWVRHVITLATTDALYGPLNPFRDRQVEESFWTFSAGTIGILSLPTWVSKTLRTEAYQCREYCTDAFVRYFEKAGHERGSYPTRRRREVMDAHGIGTSDQARLELMNVIGLLTNTVPSTFWTLLNAYSQPGVLDLVRAEAADLVQKAGPQGLNVSTGLSGSLTCDIKAIRHAPIMSALLRETIRYTSAGTGSRRVLNDTDLGGFTLHKGSMVLIPIRAMHFDDEKWPSNGTQSFDVWRFHDKRSDIHPASFRGFGGGSTMCPGRYFASTVILTTLMMFTSKFSAQSSGSRCWQYPESDTSNMTLIMNPPKRGVMVHIATRSQWKQARWQFLYPAATPPINNR